MAAFEQLPSVIHGIVMLFLENSELLNLSECSRTLWKSSNSDFLWKTKVLQLSPPTLCIEKEFKEWNPASDTLFDEKATSIQKTWKQYYINKFTLRWLSNHGSEELLTIGATVSRAPSSNTTAKKKL